MRPSGTRDLITPLDRIHWSPTASPVPALWVCPICVDARDLQDAEKFPNAKVVVATPMWEWAGGDTTVFSY